MFTLYKAARWNRQEIDDGPGAIPLKVKPRCCHQAYVRSGDDGKPTPQYGVGLDPRYAYCRNRCGFRFKIED